MTFKMPLRLLIINSFLVLFLQGCGSGNSEPATKEELTYTPGTYLAASNFKNQCQVVRTITDINGNSYPDIPGSTLHENHWLRSWSNNTYLWYAELPDIDPGTYSDSIDYFNQLRTPELTNSGNFKDKYHFIWPTSDWEEYQQAGISVSYGIKWAFTSSIPRSLYIKFIEPGSPADEVSINLTRGVKIISIDGVDVEYDSDIDTIYSGLLPNDVGESHTFVIQDVGTTQTREVILTAAEVSADPVPIVNVFNTNNGNVGYLMFNSHNYISEEELFDAVTQLQGSNINDLILDLRYNGGGLLSIASRLSYMIAGSVATSGKTFELLRFNDKYPTINPVTGSTISPTPFYNETSSYSTTYGAGVALPQLNLNRIFILATGSTCSASEAVINSLRGIDVEVIIIGDTTCGKPYGFYATDNCGTTYFTIQFDGVNDKGVGGYSDGFTPMNSPTGAGDLLPGCYVNEDYSEQLGAMNESLVASALQYRVDGSCPAITKSFMNKSLINEQKWPGEMILELKEQLKIYEESDTNAESNP